MFYNEQKVERQKASFYHSQNMPVLNPFLGDKNDRYRIFQEIEERNTWVQKKGLHISVNPIVGDLVRLGDGGIRTEIDNLKQNLESLFSQFNRMEFLTSKEMYDQALKLFQVESKKDLLLIAIVITVMGFAISD